MKPKSFLVRSGVLCQIITAFVPFVVARPHTHDHQNDGHNHLLTYPFLVSSGSANLGSEASTCYSKNPELSNTQPTTVQILQGYPPKYAGDHSIDQVDVNTNNLPPTVLQINPTKTLKGHDLDATSLNRAQTHMAITQGSLSTPLPIQSLDTSNTRKAHTGGRHSKHHIKHRRAFYAYDYGQFPEPTSSLSAVSADTTTLCPARNGTTFQTSNSNSYQVICNIDFLENDYHPFKYVASFESCVQACDTFNVNAGSNKCLAALFVPSRLDGIDDCYLKKAIDNPSIATLGIEGAILLKPSQTPTLSLVLKASSSVLVPHKGGIALTSVPHTKPFAPADASTSTLSPVSDSSQSRSAPTSSPSGSSALIASASAVRNASSTSSPEVIYATGSSIFVPKVDGTKLHGTSQNKPTKQYLNVSTPKDPALADDLLVPGVNGDLTTQYALSLDTGVLEVNSSMQSSLVPLKHTPHLSRDGGSGGYLDGKHLFIFCDTGSYSTATATSNGDFLGFVSSSVAIDTGMNGLEGKALDLEDGIGQWSDDVGRMRGFAPLTQGEQSYNKVMQGKGLRYAIWPESSLIPLDAKTAVVYAPIVYDNVNQETRAAIFTYSGATLLYISAGGEGGPTAVRKVEKIFEKDEIEWGCTGGIRSWGPSGIGGKDGKVYIFGNIRGGILLARTLPEKVADRDSYEYWNGAEWNTQMLDSSSQAFFITGSPFMDLDIFYSPRHLTFIAVYLTSYADSKFYYRYLKADSAIIPPYGPGGNKSEDIVENFLKFEWSDEELVFHAPAPLNGKYIYSGSVHRGYYGSDDITNGGSKMLLSWTAPTGLDPSSLTSEYQHITAEVHWS